MIRFYRLLRRHTRRLQPPRNDVLSVIASERCHNVIARERCHNVIASERCHNVIASERCHNVIASEAKQSINAVPPENIVLMEDHDRAYGAWKERGVRGATLVHVDAHIDFGWVPDVDMDEIDSKPANHILVNPYTRSRKKMVNIGNYICPAMREGMVSKFYWVVPDASWRSAGDMRHIIRQLKQILRMNGASGAVPEVRRDSMRCRILDKEVIVCTLDNLKRIDGPILLDIDVDFMLTPSVRKDLDPARTPWIFPEELFKKLAAKTENVSVLTIAYSVEGGFTPLRFKYLGDELRALFAGGLSEEKNAASQLKRKALLLEKERRYADAAVAYEEALKADGSDASAHFNLSLFRLGDPAEAKRLYGEAVRRDRTYATAYNNYGILYMRNNDLKRAEAEYRKFLRVDEDNISALSGLGYIALAGKRHAEAKELFDRCLSLNKDHAGARTGKGTADFKSGRMKEAEEIFAGIKKEAPDDADAYWWLGRIAEKKGEVSAAIENYKNAVMRGGEGPAVHLRLARLYMMRGMYFRVREELGRAVRLIRSRYR